MDDEAEREYERARQEQIKQNQELLASLGLNTTTTRFRSLSPPRPTKSRSRPLDISLKREGFSDTSRSLEPKRERSRRVAARRQQSYAEKDFSFNTKGESKKLKRKERQPRQGERKSSRLTGEAISSGATTQDSRYVDADTSDTDTDDYVGGRGGNISSAAARRRGPPAPPVKVNGRDWNDDEDIYTERQPLPTRDGKTGELHFGKDYDSFVPNLTPEEVLRGGAFGGTFFKPHYSTVLQRDLDPDEDLAELPAEWITGLDREKMLTSETYDMSINRHGKKAGQSLSEWEQAGWIIPADPRGWFQWYYRFYQGRRTRDDPRQISRWYKAVGPTGRFRKTAVTSVAGRQICWQWAVDAGR